MCCTGRTAIVNDANGNPVGYIYFYDFDDAWTLPKDYSIARIMNIMVSGRYLHLPPSQQTMSAITFLAKEMVPGAKKFTNAGDLYYTATIEEAKLENFQDDIYFVMGGVTVRVDVSVTPP